MQQRSVEQIVKALNDASVRYLIAGGLAVVAHGYVRMTSDVDMIVDLEVDNTRRALGALSALGYRPRAPVAMEEFANSDSRDQWVNDKNITVFSLQSPEHSATEIDLFVQPLVNFTAAYARAKTEEVGVGVQATFIGFDDLIAMKQLAGRPQDIADIDALKKCKE